MADASKTITSILRGEYDEQLVEIAQALHAREQTGEVRVRWRITFDDITIDADSATVAEARKFEDLSGIAWQFARPQVSMTRRVALIVAALITRQGMSQEDAFAKIDAKPAAELEDCISEYVDSSSPKDGGPPSMS